MKGCRDLLAVLGVWSGLALSVQAQPSFVAFESGPVRPVALAAGGNLLVAVNTPDNTLEVFAVTTSGLLYSNSIPVGLEPVAVAARNSTEVWVVNFLSDSVSIVDLVGGRVKQTLLLGDEPRDIVFADADGAGPLPQRAFITTAHRGQQRTDSSIASVSGAGDPQLTTASVARADVWVFNAANPGTELGGKPDKIVQLFGDTPRALATNGSTVYAAVFHSGNQTAVVSEGAVCNGFGTSPCSGDGITSPGGLAGGQLPGGNPGPSTNVVGSPAPEVGLIVKYNNATNKWEDEDGRNWNNGIRFTLPDLDVFAIDAGTLNQTQSWAHVGTVLFNMAVNPATGKVYVSNVDSQNHVRFEGPGGFGGSTVQGDLARARITVLDGANVLPRHLNKHINYAVRPAPAGTKSHSLATPLDMAVNAAGTKLYVAAFGSSKVGVFDTATLENDSFDPTLQSAKYIPVSGGGPSGIALDEARSRLYVTTRFDNSISVIDTVTGAELNHIPLHNPEPPEVLNGRRFLYDAALTSSNGEASCSSCHIFGDLDSLAWDLGNPDDLVSSNPIPINLSFGASGFNPPINGTGNVAQFHPMKGPMTTQTLRGMVTSGAQHWRGDRSNGFFGSSAFDSHLSFRNFIVAFPGLVGGSTPPTDPNLQAGMTAFADFALSITLPPSPIRKLDNTLTTAQQNGRNFYTGTRLSDGINFIPGVTGFTCEGCHSLNASTGSFGTGGNASFENETQIMKIPHLRNLYQKVGMFGMPHVAFDNAGDNGHKSDQVRGTGYLHDGSTDTLFRFFQATVFNDSGGVGFNGGDPQRRDMEQFMLAFDTDLAPIVGQQVTLSATNSSQVGTRIGLLIQRAQTNFSSAVLGGVAKEADLVAKAKVGGRVKGWLYNPTTLFFEPDTTGDPLLSDTQLRNVAAAGAGQEVTYLAVPPGSGYRVALDRDEDGVMNGDEVADGTDPANAGSVLGACNDGIDNDGDGLIDFGNDPGCRNVAWSIENPQCNDGWDDDNDGLVDAADPQCTSPWVISEQKKACGLLGIEPFAMLACIGAVRRLRRRA